MSDDQIGRYRIVERIGRGGMGVLYKGLDTALDREVAIKVMSNTLDGDVDHDARARFFREARAAARLQHRNIVTVFEFSEEDGVPYIVMEFLRGRSLASRMAAAPPLALEQKLDIASQLCTGLQFAHEHGVVHRDVKPANIWLLDDGTVKLLDFGIAKVSSSTLTKTGDVVGSAAYMSPEQVSGRPVDGRSDIFSSGVVLYELLAGRTPFEADSPTATILKIAHDEPAPIASVATGIPPDLSAALAQALEKDPAKRYQSAGDFGADLQLVRMSLLSSSETVLAADLPLTRPRHAAPAAVIAAVDAVDPRGISQIAPPIAEVALPAPSRSGRTSPAVAIAAAAALMVVAGSAWLIATRSARHPSPGSPVGGGPSEAQTTPPIVRPVTPRSLKVDSQPDGAAIAIDGQDTGSVTPASVSWTAAMPRRVTLTKRGFQRLEAELSSSAVDSGSVSYQLAAEAVTVKVTATGSYPFEIIDGKRVLSAAATSHEVSVTAPRSLRLRAAAQLLDYPFKVDANAGPTLRVNAPALGTLTVRSPMETCQVSANGHDLGFPPVNNQSVAAGTYELKLNCPDGQKARSAAVTVVAGETRIARLP